VIIKVFNASKYHFERKTSGASGFDLAADEPEAKRIEPGGRILVRTGIHLRMPLGIEAQVRPRSGLARDHGVMAAVGTVDSDYTGEIGVTLFNLGLYTHVVQPGDRVAQLAFMPVLLPTLKGQSFDGAPDSPFISFGLAGFQSVEIEFVDSLEALGVTGRGAAGWGSTGR
jgi:dUTP diphosphatase